MLKKLRQITGGLMAIGAVVGAKVANAQQSLSQLITQNTQGPQGIITAIYGQQTSQSLPQFAGAIIKAFLGLIGVVLVAYILYGGYTYMTAKGETKDVTKATGIIRDAIIGLVIILSAYAIVNFVLTQVVTQALSTGS